MAKLMRWCCFGAVLAMVSACLHAAEFPSRPIRLVVPSTPGGALDVLGRAMSPKLGEKWGQQVVIDNRAGAGGIIGTEMVAKAAPDGHTLLIVTTGFVTNPFLYKSLPYETPRDFLPIILAGMTANVVVVHPSVPVRNLKELIALAKGKPGQLNFASSGVGTGGHLATELLIRMAGLKLTHVPYKGAGAATTAVVAGETQLLITAVAAALQQTKAGRLRPIAVTGKKRSDELPDLPTVAEAGLPGYVAESWYGMFGPAAMPKALVTRIYGDILSVICMPEVADQLSSVGFDIIGMPPDEWGAFINTELKTWSAVIKESGIKVE